MLRIAHYCLLGRLFVENNVIDLDWQRCSESNFTSALYPNREVTCVESTLTR